MTKYLRPEEVANAHCKGGQRPGQRVAAAYSHPYTQMQPPTSETCRSPTHARTSACARSLSCSKFRATPIWPPCMSPVHGGKGGGRGALGSARGSVMHIDKGPPGAAAAAAAVRPTSVLLLLARDTVRTPLCVWNRRAGERLHCSWKRTAADARVACPHSGTSAATTCVGVQSAVEPSYVSCCF